MTKHKGGRPKPDEDLICAHIWDRILRTAFSPRSTKEQRTWLQLWLTSLKSLWGLSGYPSRTRSRLLFEARIPREDLIFDVIIKEPARFSVEFEGAIGQIQPRSIWTHDVDGNFFALPLRKLLDSAPSVRNATRSQVEKVLEAMVFHPRAHQHLHWPINDHLIRLGGGIDNAFLYLFNLRFQFCPCKSLRDQESNRLVDLFTDMLSEKDSNAIIPPARLFDL